MQQPQRQLTGPVQCTILPTPWSMPRCLLPYPLPVAAAPAVSHTVPAAAVTIQLFGELQRGKSVTAINGRTVHAHEVMASPTMPGPCLIILDCPSLDHLAALQAEPMLQQLQQESAAQPAPQAAGDAAAAQNGSGNGSGESGEAAPRKRFVLVHMGPAEVSRSAAYAAWCAGFGPGADQLFASSDGQRCTTTRRAAQLQAQLNVIEPDVFPLQGFAALKQQQQEQQQEKEKDPQQGAAAAAGVQSVDGADGVVFRLVPARMQGLCIEAALTQPPDLEAVQVSSAVGTGAWLPVTLSLWFDSLLCAVWSS